MDQNQGGGDPNEQFHRNEAISAVVDEAFLGEEDDDYEDLYNDVNVGEGFLQSVRMNEDLGFRDEEKVEKKLEPVPPPPPPPPPPAAGVAGGGVAAGDKKFEGNDGRVELGQTESQSLINNNNMHHNVNTGNVGNSGNGGGDVNGSGGNVYGNGGGGGGGGFAGGGGGFASGGGGTILFVGDLHWWTTDAELESELCKYGHVKEVKFFDEKASGKSKGYCQVEFYDPAAAIACKEGMNGHVFNGRPCVVAFASPYSVKRMGEAQVNKNQQFAQTKRGPGDPPAKPSGSNMPVGNDNNRAYGRGNWGRGNAQGMAGRGMGRGGRGMSGFGPQFGGPMGFDPSFGGPMGRMGGYGGFPGGPTPPFSGMMPPFPPVGNVGLPGFAPHVNPAFFGRGMGMMPAGGVDGPNMGMWSDPNMPGWTGDEHGGRVGESSYGEEAGSDQHYGEKDRDRDPGYERDLPRDKDVVHENEWPERRHRDHERSRDRDRERSRDRDRDRERSRDRERGRDRHREERDRYGDHHRYREVEPEYDDEWDQERDRDRGRSSRAHGKSRLDHEDEHRIRARDADYGKRRRVTAE